MAEAVGLVIGGISLISLFDSCMNAFDYLESGKTYGREYQKSAVKVSLLQLRLSRWAESVQGVTKSKGSAAIGSLEDAETAKDLLGEIAAGIKGTEAVAKRYQVKNTAEPSTRDMTMDALASKVKTMALKRQKNSSLGQKTRWALRDQRRFDKLINDLALYVGELEALFPAERFPAVVQNQKRLAESEASELVQPAEVEEPSDGESVPIEVLKEATLDVDTVLREAVQMAARKANFRHDYSGKFNHSDNTRINVGDYVATGDRKIGQGSNFSGEFYATGSAHVNYGDTFGGRYVLDD